MLVDKLKEVAAVNGMEFNYGNYSWQNLLDLLNDNDKPEQQIYFLLLWKDREIKFNVFNAVESETYDGEFLLVMRSEFDDEDYNYKYEHRIKKLERSAEGIHNNISSCDNLFFEYWKETEVANQLDTNVDGLKVKFKIRHDF